MNDPIIVFTIINLTETFLLYHPYLRRNKYKLTYMNEDMHDYFYGIFFLTVQF